MGAERQEWIQRVPVNPCVRAASLPQQQPQDRGSKQPHGRDKSAAPSVSVGMTEGAAQDTLRPDHKKKTLRTEYVGPPKSSNNAQNASVTAARTTEPQQERTEREAHNDATSTAEPFKSVVPKHLPDNRSDAPLKTRAQIECERQAKVQDVQSCKVSFEQLKIWTKQWRVEDVAWKEATASSQAASQSAPSTVPASVHSPSPAAPASVPATGTRARVTNAVSFATRPKAVKAGSHILAS